MSFHDFICRLRLVLRDRSGTSVLETAFVIPMLSVVVMGASDVALAFAQKIRVQQAASRTAEMATAGGASFAASTLQADAAAAAGVPPNSVVVDQWLECGGVRQASTVVACTTGQFARYVTVSITGSYTPFFPALAMWSGHMANGSITVTGFSSVRVQ